MFSLRLAIILRAHFCNLSLGDRVGAEPLELSAESWPAPTVEPPDAPESTVDSPPVFRSTDEPPVAPEVTGEPPVAPESTLGGTLETSPLGVTPLAPEVTSEPPVDPVASGSTSERTVAVVPPVFG